MKRLILSIFIFSLLVLPALGFAQPDSGQIDEKKSLSKQELIEKWKSLPEEEKQRLKESYNKFQAMPDEKKEKVRDNYKKFKKMPKERRENIDSNLKRFEKLPQEQRKNIRNNWKKFQGLPKERKQQLRQDFNKRVMQQKPPQERRVEQAPAQKPAEDKGRHRRENYQEYQGKIEKEPPVHKPPVDIQGFPFPGAPAGVPGGAPALKESAPSKDQKQPLFKPIKKDDKKKIKGQEDFTLQNQGAPRRSSKPVRQPSSGAIKNNPANNQLINR